MRHQYSGGESPDAPYILYRALNFGYLEEQLIALGAASASPLNIPVGSYLITGLTDSPDIYVLVFFITRNGRAFGSSSTPAFLEI